MKLAIVVGTRPEIIKMAPVVRAAEEMGLPCAVIHTGQHYSFEMDGIFFDQLELHPPDVNLAIGSGTHAQQLAGMIGSLEAAIEEAAPDVVLVEGDTNSVLAAGMTANKLGVRVAHVEAGLRSRDRTMPEEINRILVDHLADDLFAPTSTAAANLVAEAIPASRISVTGNTVVDEVLRHLDSARLRRVPDRLGLASGAYMVATVHRAENVNDAARLAGIVDGLGRVARRHRMPILVALHPRTSARIGELQLVLDALVQPMPPLGYLEFLGLHQGAALLLTDSGGLQEEACTIHVPSVTLRDSTERPEAVAVGASVLAGANPDVIADAAALMVDADRTWPNPFGDGRSGTRIVEELALGRPDLPVSPLGEPAATLAPASETAHPAV